MVSQTPLPETLKLRRVGAESASMDVPLTDGLREGCAQVDLGVTSSAVLPMKSERLPAPPVTTALNQTCIGMGLKPTGESSAARFGELYDCTYADVLRFVRRRAGPDSAEDVAHEAFLVAWRRLEDVPVECHAARAWLFGIARNCLLSDLRGHARRNALSVRIASETLTTTDPDDGLALRLDLVTAWHQLRADEQEVLSLAIWEDLSSQLAGRVLGISSAAYRIRLHRARAKLRQLLDTATFPASTADYLVTERTI
ncbi:RNA polymerase sigma factor [Cryobacterium sinapicolor]